MTVNEPGTGQTIVKRFRVEMTAAKVLEVRLNENDLMWGEDDLADGAEALAIECAFRNDYQDMVTIVEDWDVTVEEVREIAATGTADQENGG